MAKKNNKSGADAAPTFPAKLTAVAEGAAALSVDEVIDRLYEVASGSIAPTTYGFHTREKAEEALTKMGKAGKAALARAMAHRAAEAVNKAAPVVPAAPAALDPAGPDDDFVLEDAACGGEGGGESTQEPSAPLWGGLVETVDAQAEATVMDALAGVGDPKSKAVRLAELQAMSRAELETIFGRTVDTKHKDFMIRCWIITREFGNAAGPNSRTASKNPKTRAVAKYVAAAKALRETFQDVIKELDIDPAEQILSALQQVDVGADYFQTLLKNEQDAARQAAAASRAPRAPRAPREPRVEKPSVKVGSTANVATKFAARYEDALSAEEMRGLKVTAIRRGLAVCTTSAGEEARLPYAHLEAAVEAAVA